MDLPGLLTEIAIRHLWQGLLIIGIISLLLAGRRIWSAEHRSWLWTAGLILSATLPLLTLVNLPAMPMPAMGQQADAIPAAPVAAPAPHMLQPQEGLFATLGAALGAARELVSTLPVTLILSALAAIWMGVAVWKLFRIASAARQTQALRRTLAPCPLSTDMVPANWPAHIEVMQSEAVRTPMAIGFFRYNVVLPASLVTTLPQHQIRHILSHELAHIRRGDLQFALIQRIIEAVFWWSPLTWFVGARLREEREMACDDRAVVMNGCSRQYASALLESVTVMVAGKGRDAGDVLALSAFDHHSRRAFQTRIRRLIGRGYCSSVAMGKAQIAGVSVATVAVAALFILSPRADFGDDAALTGDRPYLTASSGLENADRYLVDIALPSVPLMSEPLEGARAIRIAQPQLSEMITASIAAARQKVQEKDYVCTDDEHDHHDDMQAANQLYADGEAMIEIERMVETDIDVDVHHDFHAEDARTQIVIVTRNERNEIVSHRINHGDAQSITITSKSGKTITMKLDDEKAQELLLSGGTGEIVTIH